MSKTFVCKGKRLANYLIDHGCKLYHIDCDKDAKGFLVFLFNRDKELDCALESWKQDKETYLIS